MFVDRDFVWSIDQAYLGGVKQIHLYFRLNEMKIINLMRLGFMFEFKITTIVR